MQRRQSGCDSPTDYARLSAGKCQARNRGLASCHRRSPTDSFSITTRSRDKCQPKRAVPPTPIESSAPVLDSCCPPAKSRNVEKTYKLHDDVVVRKCSGRSLG